VKILSEEAWELNSGMPGVRFLLNTNQGQELILISLVGDRFITLAGSGDFVLKEQIMRTLREY